MKPNTASVLLKAVLIISTIAILSIVFWGVPQYMQHVVYVRPSLSVWIWPMQLYAGLLTVPVLLAITLLWRVFTTVATGEAFSMLNAIRFERIKWLAAGDLLLVLILAAFLILSGVIPAFILLCLLAAIYIGVVAVIVFHVLGALVRNAAQIKQENELTI